MGNTNSDYVGNLFMKSFVYDVSKKQISWLTEYDEADLTKGGYFSGVSDNGIICGTSKDADQKFNGTPINCAAIWTLEGERVLLEYGSFDMATINTSNDGSFAKAISADGNVIAGYFNTHNGAYLTPCMWTKGGGGDYTLTLLPMPDGAKGGQTMAVSADGSVVGGYVRLADSSKYPALWKDGECIIIDYAKFGLEDGSYSIDLSGMSANGRFITVSVEGGYGYVYDVEKDEAHSLPIIDYIYSSFGDILSDISGFAVDNEGNVVYSIGYNGYWRPLWYYYAEDRVLDLTYFTDIFAYGLKTDISLSVDEQSPAKTVAVSGDGNVIIGNVDNVFAPQLWVLQVEKSSTKIPATPSGLKGVATGLGQVTLYWDKDENKYEGFTLKSYNIYCNGGKVKEVSASEQEMKAVIDDVPSGKPGFDIEAVFEREDGTTVLSPKSKAIQVIVASTWEMPLYEDFSSGGIDLNAWEVSYDEGSNEDVSISIDDSYGIDWSIGCALRTHPGKPYSFYLASRQIDATEEDNVHMSFYVSHGLINIEGQILDKDNLGIDVSTDGGLTWTEIKSWDVESLSPSGRQWTLVGLDLSKIAAGKTFRVRFHMYGPGESYYYVKIDNISICGAPAHEAPTGLINEVCEDGKSVKIAWQDPSNAYKLNYINECPSYRFTIGNGGKEVIGANKFEPADLKMFDGKYLTGVTTKINLYEDRTNTKGVRASVVIYEDGKLVREQEAKDFPYNEEFTVVLDQPVAINANKELMIGVKVFDYDAEQIPLCYVQSLNYLPGKSDLYSEDGGKTWQLVSDFYKTQEEPAEGWACWDITGCITDSPELTLSSEPQPYAYIVYRDGERVSDLAISGKSARFTDNAPEDDACYEVVAYYDKGEYSETSEQMCIGTLTSIRNYVVDGVRVEMSPEAGTMTISGDFDSASLYNINGMYVGKCANGTVNISGLPSGVYLLKIEKDGKSSVRKMMIRR